MSEIISKGKFLRDAEEAWDGAFKCEGGNPGKYTIIFEKHNVHSGPMNCSDILSWAMEHYLYKMVRAEIEKAKRKEG